MRATIVLNAHEDPINFDDLEPLGGQGPLVFLPSGALGVFRVGGVQHFYAQWLSVIAQPTETDKLLIATPTP